MTNLQRLKEDRDICYTLAAAAYGQEYVNELCHEGDEINDESTRRLEALRSTLKPVEHKRVVEDESSKRAAARTFHTNASIQDEWYMQ